MPKKRRKKGPRIVHDPNIGFVIIKGNNGDRKILGIDGVGWFRDPGKFKRAKQSERIKSYNSSADAKPDLNAILRCYQNN